ncbi:hypothetical protein BMW26_02595 [Microbacterium sp. 1.5R]|uniref:phosphotransferase n=1 Tax=Microbacterium sp. 1.5R TaxID=1916917 RepID=UPI00090C30E0|nr:phosphotransferase [Microbacterium sp. 1.5R]APH43973.1 hypothetical protein BMW26_02595 [Microbacterium sp. 1.5R]
MNGFARERAAKAALAAALRERSADVAPGVWRILDTRSAVLPEHRQGWRIVIDHLGRGSGAKRALLDMRRLLAAPRRVRLGDPEAGMPAAQMPVRVLMTKDGGLVGFDRADSTVTHLRRTALPPEYRERRLALGEVYSAVEWHLDDDGRRLTEARVPGRPAQLWAPADRIALLRTLLVISTSRLTADAAAQPLLTEARAALEGLSGQARWEEAGRAADLVGEVPWVLAHGDLTPENVLGHGPEDWGPIDFEDARPAPFFYDALSLAVRDDAMRAALSGGELEEEWCDLLSAAGVDPAILTPVIAMDIVAVIAADHHRREHGGDFGYTLASLT